MPPEQVPLRDHLEMLFAQHSSHVDAEFAELKAELRLNRDHVHRQNPTWGQLATLFVAIVAISVPLAAMLI